MPRTNDQIGRGVSVLSVKAWFFNISVLEIRCWDLKFHPNLCLIVGNVCAEWRIFFVSSLNWISESEHLIGDQDSRRRGASLCITSRGPSCATRSRTGTCRLLGLLATGLSRAQDHNGGSFKPSTHILDFVGIDADPSLIRRILGTCCNVASATRIFVEDSN